MGAAGARLPCMLDEEAVYMNLSGVSLPAHSARRLPSPQRSWLLADNPRKHLCAGAAGVGASARQNGKRHE